MHDTEIELAHLSCQLCAEIDFLWLTIRRQTDPTREKCGQVVARFSGTVEVAGSFQKELPLLRKEQRKAREIDLAVIDFCLGKIGVDGEVCLQLRRQVVEQVETPFAFVSGISRRNAAGRRVVRADQVRLNVEAITLTDITDAFDTTC